MANIQRKCDNCGKDYLADERNTKRGWGLCCSKSCAAAKREKDKPTYNAARVERNNERRANWKPYYDRETATAVEGYTDEGYRIIDGVAVDEFDAPVYNVR